jgi:hypothetical protein
MGAFDELISEEELEHSGERDGTVLNDNAQLFRLFLDVEHLKALQATHRYDDGALTRVHLMHVQKEGAERSTTSGVDGHMERKWEDELSWEYCAGRVDGPGRQPSAPLSFFSLGGMGVDTSNGSHWL